MAASQGHGFMLEGPIASALYPGASALGYTHEFDLPAGHSSWGPHACQIKCATATRHDAPPAGVMLGDALRNFNKSMPFEMVIADMAQAGQRKVARRYVRLLFAAGAFPLALFAGATRAEIEALDKQVKAIPLGLQPALREAAHEAKRALKSKHGFAVDLQAKISTTGSQRRLQASCSQEALIHAASRSQVIAPAEFAALGLPESIASPRRARKPRTQVNAQAPAQVPTSTAERA